ncbi:MAG: L-histidine N(alpha)-methyltransferase [Rhodospirillales bacterium]|nr:L-histidine N(alpha)-methyltransferase [Rhodospirillales bacterium]MSP80071.1 L-histidine N(alpha)-methyltransferase [Rhodospirillales bacterium]
MDTKTGSDIEVVETLARGQGFAEAVRAGLACAPKIIPAKYFYDAEGARLFAAICDLPEYYLTRVELEILRARAHAAAALAGPGCHLIEFGSGASVKVGLLLDALVQPRSYVAIDISREFLLAGARAVAQTHPRLRVVAVHGDYAGPEALALPDLGAGRRLGFFPGSTIGNLTPEESVGFLKRARVLLENGDLIVGVDTKKDKKILDAAYDDAQGVTADFNLNLLRRANAELGADFDLAAFRHVAFYNAARGWIEMHLESLKAQAVRVSGRAFPFRAGETILTEISCKYAVAEFQDVARAAGFAPLEAWTDDRARFSVHYLRGTG